MTKTIREQITETKKYTKI